MSEPHDEVLDIWMRGEGEPVANEERTMIGIDAHEPPAASAPPADEDEDAVFLPFMVESARIERAKARMWHALSLLLFLIVAASVVPLIVASAKAVAWLASL